MDKIITYANDLIKNHPLESDNDDYYSFEKKISQKGGAIKEDANSKPTGGFPPIYICEKEDKGTESLFKEESKTKREYSKLR